MATQLSIVNNVLRRLREDTVTSVADNAYAQLLAMFINDGLREMQEAYAWSSLQHTVEFDTVADQQEYDLSATIAGGGSVDNAFSPTNGGSMLRFDNTNRAIAYFYDTSVDDVPDARLIYQTEDEITRRTLNDRDYTDPTSYAFSLKSTDNADGFLCWLYPTPSEASKRVRIAFQTPQADLAIDGTDDATELKVPSAPVEAYVNMIAANERGEELGEPGNLLERRYLNTLGGAIEQAISADGRANRYESWRD